MLSSLIVATMLTMASDPDGVVSTAPKGDGAVIVGAVAPSAAEVPSVSIQEITPHGLSTDEQIDRWIAQRAEAERPFSGEGEPWEVEDDRKIHGEISAGIGTNDYRSYSASVSIPVGDTARVNLSYRQGRNDYFGHRPWRSHGWHDGDDRPFFSERDAF